MKEINKKINNLQNSISKIDNEEYKKLFNEIDEILKDLSKKVETVMTNEAVLAENINYMNNDIVDIQDELFEEVSLEELSEMEDSYTEVKCKNCDKPIYMETSAFKNKDIKCPYCGENIN